MERAERSDRLQNVSKIEVEAREFQRTRVDRSEVANPFVTGGLRPEVARHHQLTKSPRLADVGVRAAALEARAAVVDGHGKVVHGDPVTDVSVEAIGLLDEDDATGGSGLEKLSTPQSRIEDSLEHGIPSLA